MLAHSGPRLPLVRDPLLRFGPCPCGEELQEQQQEEGTAFHWVRESGVSASWIGAAKVQFSSVWFALTGRKTLSLAKRAFLGESSVGFHETPRRLHFARNLPGGGHHRHGRPHRGAERLGCFCRG